MFKTKTKHFLKNSHDSLTSHVLKKTVIKYELSTLKIRGTNNDYKIMSTHSPLSHVFWLQVEVNVPSVLLIDPQPPATSVLLIFCLHHAGWRASVLVAVIG